MWYSQKLVFTSLIITLTLSLAAGDRTQPLWKRLQEVKLSVNTIPVFYNYAVKSIAGPRRIRARFATKSTKQSDKLAALARDVDGNYYSPIMVFEEPFLISIKNVVIVNRPRNTFKGHDGLMASFTMETRAYQILRVPSEDSVLNLPFPPDCPKNPFVEIPGRLTKDKYRDLLKYAHDNIQDNILEGENKITKSSNFKSPLRYSLRKPDRPDFPIPAFIRDAVNGYFLERSYSRYLIDKTAIVLLHCRNDDPTSYYSLVWYPDHPKYTSTTLLSHLDVTYDAKRVFGFVTSTTFGGTLARVRRSLATPTANLCTNDISEFKVVFTYHY